MSEVVGKFYKIPDYFDVDDFVLMRWIRDGWLYDGYCIVGKLLYISYYRDAVDLGGAIENNKYWRRTNEDASVENFHINGPSEIRKLSFDEYCFYKLGATDGVCKSM